jgi:hypothetical protein
VSCYVKRRQPPDVSSDGLNCILNFCDCSVAVVGGERLPSYSINSALASPAFSHFLLLLAISSPLLPSTPPWARARKVVALRITRATSASASRLLPRRTSATRSTRRRSSPPSPRALRLLPLPRRRLMIQTTPRGSPRRYGLTSGPSSVRGLEGSDELEYSSDEENSSDSSEEGGGGDGDDDGGDGDGGGDSGKGGDGSGKGGSGDGSGGSKGSSKGSNKASG